MTTEQFDRLVKRYEREAARNPQWYRFRVGLFVFFGYAYILLLLLLALGVIGGLVYYATQLPRFTGAYLRLSIPIMIFMGAMAWMIVRSLIVRLPPVDGMEITRAQAPRLFAMLDGLREELRTLPIHRVLITPEFNAAMVQRPRLGIFGWQQNCLIIGLPLLQILGYSHARGVIAHELGHLSRQHGRFTQWIYRQVRTWENLMDHLEEREQRWDVFTPFFEWFAPRLQAMSFALRRQGEYEADRAAVQAVGTQAYGEALCLSAVAGEWLSDYWKRVYDQVKHSHMPVGKPFHELGTAFRREWNPARATHALQEAINRPTDVADTHPSLLDRLRAIGYVKPSPDPLRPTPLPLPNPPAQSAAEYLLGAMETALADRLHADWQQAMQPVWQAQYQHLQQTRAEVAQLQQKAQQTPLSADELYALAEGTLELHGEAHALPILQQVLQLNPNHAPANFLMGAILIRQDNDAGVAYLERAMQLDPHCTTEAAGLLYDYFMRKGDLQRATTYRHQIRAYHDQLAAAHHERKNISMRDKFLPHGLTPAQLQQVLQQIGNDPDIVRAYLVQKEVKAFKEEPLLVLGIRPRWSSTGQKSRQLLERLTEQVTYPYPTFVIILVGENKPFEKVFAQVPGALILSR